jgi:transposase
LRRQQQQRRRRQQQQQRWRRRRQQQQQRWRRRRRRRWLLLSAYVFQLHFAHGKINLHALTRNCNRPVNSALASIPIISRRF